MNHTINNQGHVSGSLVRGERGLEIIARVIPSQVSDYLVARCTCKCSDNGKSKQGMRWLALETHSDTHTHKSSMNGK